MDNGGFYISPKISFSDISSMIKHYHSESFKKNVILLLKYVWYPIFLLSKPMRKIDFIAKVLFLKFDSQHLKIT